ncbi:MAG TPA: metallophosphoesterase [Polyangiaceae bacterium]|nr:metallophosphoesterase [Polyangiaceae bacterium]
MPELLRFAIFILVFLSIVGAGHYYAWARLVRDLELPLMVHRALTVAVIALFVLLVVSLVAGRSLPPSIRSSLLVPAFSWLGVLWLFIVSLLLADLIRFGFTSVSHLAQAALSTAAPAQDDARRLFVSRLLASVVLLVGGGATGVALATGLGGAVVRKVQVKLSRLPAAMSGTRIVQLSDVHLGPTLGLDFINDIVERTNALNPDIVAITGDLVDGSVASIGHLVEPLAKLKARYGVFFVTGNHEYYSGAVEWCQHLAQIGIRVLRNERVSIGSAEHSFDLAGIDDHHAAQFGHGHGADIARATQGRDPSRSLVLLAHQPVQALQAESFGVELQLSGHTHGGQLWPFNYLVKLQQPVVAGMGRVGRTMVYVNSGTGYWGPPMRLGTTSEITEITLLSS